MPLIITTKKIEIETPPPPNMFIRLLGGVNSDYGSEIITDTSGNIYVVGSTASSGNSEPDGHGLLLVKYNSSGNIIWQRVLGGSGTVVGNGITTDSSGNIYVVGYSSETRGSGSIYDLLIAKYNSSGTIQWQRLLGGSNSDYGSGITTDSNGNIYVSGYTYSQGAGISDLLIAKYNSSGTIQWQRLLGGTGGEIGYGITTDSNDNIYVTGYTGSQGAGSNDLLLAKYNSDGNIIWQRILGGTGGEVGSGITTDSSDNIYVVGRTSSQGAGSNDLLFAKYNSDGNIIWQRRLGGVIVDDGFGITIDSSGNIYVIGFTQSQGAGNYDLLIAKYNSDAIIIWQRLLGGSGEDNGYKITTDSNDNIYVTGYTRSQGAGGVDLLLAKLPNDGSGLGTYGNFTYQASTLARGTTTLTAQTSTLTVTESSLTGQESTWTSATSTLTETVVI